MDDNELVTITTFLTAHEAELARGFLECNGIEVFLADMVMSRVEVPTIVGGIKLQVRRADVRSALELLASVE